MHHYFGTLEQYQDIPRVTLSVNGEQCMCRRVARRIPRYCSSLPERSYRRRLLFATDSTLFAFLSDVSFTASHSFLFAIFICVREYKAFLNHSRNTKNK